MTRFHHKITGTVLFLLLYNWAFPQAPSFYHLTTANGLYDNAVRSLAIDRQGFLWIGTEEGLNMYNGHSTTVFLKEKHKELPSDLITYLFSDNQKRLWIGTPDGIAWMDSRRKFHRLVLGDTLLRFAIKAIIETETNGVAFVTSHGHFQFDENKRVGVRLKEPSVLFRPEKIIAVQPLGGGKTLLLVDTTLVIYDYKTANVTKLYASAGLSSICKLKGDEVAIGKETGEVLVMDIPRKKILRRYVLHDGSYPKQTLSKPIEIKQAANGDLIIAAGFNGLYTIDSSGTVAHFLHEPVNPTSLVSNSVYRLATGKDGEVVIGTSTSGVSMYNTHLSQAGFKGFFTGSNSHHYDNYTGPMLEGEGNTIWIGAYDRLIKWNRETNTSQFYFYTGASKTERGDVRALCRDKSGQLWVNIDNRGIFSFSKSSGFTQLKLDTALSHAFGAPSMPGMVLDEDGMIWVCTNKGVFTFNPANRKANALHPIAKALAGQIVQSVFIDSKKRMWFATLGNGIYCFEKEGRLLANYSVKEGLPSNICYIVTEDKKGRYFITTSKGLAWILPDGSMRSFTKQTGLRYDRCESVVVADDNSIWFSNKKCLARFNADTKELQFFDEKAGLLNNGFRVGSCLKTIDGELLWGGYRGVSYFKPQTLTNTNLPLQVSIYAVQVQDSLADIFSGNSVRVPYSNNSLTIAFAGVHLGVPGKTYYQYRLKGFDSEWQRSEDVQTVRYTTLPPGEYSFELKASLDGIHWVEAQSKPSIVIVPPLWMRWWFISVSAILFAGLIYWFVQTRNRKLKQRNEALEAEQAVNHFASSLHEHQSVDAILWDVARNCIGRLQFEDCVIYLSDEGRNVLVQKAAYGPKSPKTFQINSPIEIPVGKGIVGAVAQTGKAELIGDTSKDSRYIVDDERRFSEISVPLIWGGKVIGVIDCEHRQKYYFTQKHLSILITIASLCANKIIRAQAEEEKRKAQSILTDTQQKMAEAEMQALRAQMNPHFIFNCLNSINRYILKSDEATASLYLTRFAKLIRLILDNSSSKKVLLSNELEALKLYIEMEALRFDKKFLYSITVDKNVNVDGIELPSLMIQPYVENAIWHGLLHKEGEGELCVSLRMADEGMLECTIDDNGIGRAKAKLVKSKSAAPRKSLGMQLTEKRLALLNQQTEMNASVSIIDKEDETNIATGTKVILQIPV